jgi:hypothetical protein
MVLRNDSKKQQLRLKGGQAAAETAVVHVKRPAVIQSMQLQRRADVTLKMMKPLS